MLEVASTNCSGPTPCLRRGYTEVMRRCFNTEGPIQLAKHYALDPLRRLNLAEVMPLVEAERYFILHAPRQTGKTSALKAWRDHLNGLGTHRAFYLNVEGGQAYRNDWNQAHLALGQAFLQQCVADGFDPRPLLEASPLTQGRDRSSLTLNELLVAWAASDPRPAVLLLDEVDALVGDTLIGLLRGLRTGYANRPHAYPAAAVLCGVRDVRDYRFLDGGGQVVTGGSAFNIKAASLTMGNFTEAEVVELLGQHTEATGRVFEAEALARVYYLTEGQPWLVNALAKRVVERVAPEAERYSSDHVDEAKEALILERTVHLDQLAYRLEEPRVARVMGPILAGAENWDEGAMPDDLQYVRDLGLVVGRPPRVANPIYREVLPRELTHMRQESILNQEPAWYVEADGGLNLAKLLRAYGDFHRANIEAWSKRERYPEVAHQLLLQAFLQRLVNGGGMVEREYALGSGRTDLAVKWRRPTGGFEAKVLELKVLRPKDGFEAVASEGEVQTRAYMARMGAKEGHQVLFDAREPGVPFAPASEPVDLGGGLWRWVF